VQAAYTRPGAAADRLDGLTVSLGHGRWFNLRPSNTEPLLRLNVEAPDFATMAALRDEVLALVADNPQSAASLPARPDHAQPLT
jgi:phosphomannomutase